MTTNHGMKQWAVPGVLILAAIAVAPLQQVFVEAKDECAVYLAKASSPQSSLPVSFYSGLKMSKGEYVQVPDIGIHMVDFVDQNAQTKLSPTFLDIMWTPSELSSQYEDATGESGLAMLSGMAFSGTENPGVCNIRWDHRTVLHRYASSEPTGSLDYRTDAMAGAITEHFGLQMVTIDDVEVGIEFFPFFGETWFDAKEEEAAQQAEVVTKANYEKADQILADFANLLAKHEDYFAKNKDKAQDYWRLIRDDVVTSPKVRLLLPEEHDKVPHHAETGTAILRNPGIKRSLDYLQTKGTCADNIVQKKSTIDGAGRGGFAKRALSKGDIVAPAPLVRFDIETLLMLERDEMNGVKEDSEVVTEQLALNYVFGHPSSNMVFFPYGMGVSLINHASYDSGRKANVKIVWSDKEYHDKSYLDMPISEIMKKGVSEMAHVMDIVALRDIKEGEEFLLDYGKDFDLALKEFIAGFKPVGLGAPPKAATLNMLQEKIRTVDEQRSNPYPKSVGTFCFIDDAVATKIDLASDPDEDDINPQEGDAATVESGKPRPKMALPDLSFFNEESDVKLYNITFDAVEVECDVLIRDENVPGSDEPWYIVRLIQGSDDENNPYVIDMPQSSITFLDQEYTSPMHDPRAFRHMIQIPDDIFPDLWKKGPGDDDDDDY